MLKILRFVTALGGIMSATVSAGAQDLAGLTQAWADLKYHHLHDPGALQAAETLERQAAVLSAQENSTAARVLQADVLCLTAEILHSLNSLGKVRQARDILLEAEKQAPDDADVLTRLGSLYYEVPSWPIGFGDHKKADAYLRRALDLDPRGRDANFFMGDFLLQSGQAADAVPYLERAHAAPQQDTEFDRGRHDEIDAVLKKAHGKSRPR